MEKEVATFVRPDGTHCEQHPKNGSKFTLEEMQAAVGGLIEIVPSSREGFVLVVNEDGLGLGLPENPTGRQLLDPRYRWPGVPVVGNVLLVPNSMID